MRPVLVALALALSTHAAAQELDVGRACLPAPVEEGDTAPVAPVGPLGPSDLAVWAERDSDCVDQFLTAMRDDATRRRVRAGLEMMRVELTDHARAQEARRLEDASLRDLDRDGAAWRSELTELHTWSDSVRARLRSVSQVRQEAEEMRTRWARTAEATRTDPVLVGAQGTASELVTSLDALRAEVSKTEAELLTLLSSVSAVELPAREALRRVETARTEARLGLFRISAPPLPLALLRINPIAWATEISTAAGSRLGVVASWAGASPGRLGLHALLVVVLAGLARFLGRPMSSAPPDPRDEASLRTLYRRPIAVGFLGALVPLSTTLGAPPGEVRDLLQLTGALAVARLVGVLRKGAVAQVSVDLLTMVFAFGSVLLLLPDDLVRRSALFVCGVAGVWVTTRALRLLREEEDSSIGRVLGWVLPAIRAGFLLGATAELIGLSRLAEQSIVSMMLLAYAGIQVRVVSNLVTAVLVTRPLTLLGTVLRSAKRHRALFADRLRKGVALLALAAWCGSTLFLLGVGLDAMDLAGRVFGASVHVGEFELRLGDVVGFVVAVWASFLLSRLVRFSMEEEVFPRTNLPKGVPEAAASLTHYGILCLGMLLALSVVGIDMDRLVIVLSALGVGIGFGLQNVVGNFVSGLILLFERPVTAGDTIEISGLIGVVTRVGMRASVVLTYDGAEVIVPNMDLVAAQVVNWTHSNRSRRIEVSVGVTYGTSASTVLDLLRGVAAEHADVLETPTPTALFQGFGDSSLDFTLRCWVSEFERMYEVRSELHVLVQEKLKEAHIEVPFPQRDLHVRSVAPGLAQAVATPEVDADAQRRTALDQD